MRLTHEGSPVALRRWINDRHGRMMSRRVNRASYNKRVLLVADHWDGSVQQFYHFLLGYLLPVAQWVQKNPGVPIALRDCGPMQPWLDLLAEKVDLEVIPPGTALHMIVGDRMAHEVLIGLDNPASFSAAAIRAAAADLLAVLDYHPPSGVTGRKTVVVDRATSESFYRGPQSETHMSGGERRSTPNLARLAEVASLDTTIVDLARISPLEQLDLMQRTGVLVGQHGAGLVHMIWMRPPASVIEIAPPLPPEVVDLFEALASSLELDYQRVEQADVHAQVDLDAVATAIRGVQLRI